MKPAVKDPVVELWQSISSIYRTAIKRVNTRLARDRISFSQYSVLRALGKFGPMPMARLSEHMLVAPANITGLVDRMEKKGFVRRRRVEGDRRLWYVELTDRGRASYTTISGQFWGYVRRVFSSLSEDERTVLLSLLAKVREGVEKTELSE